MVHPLWKPAWQLLIKLNIHLTNKSALVPKRKENICPQKDLHENVHSILTPSKQTWKPKSPSTGEQLSCGVRDIRHMGELELTELRCPGALLRCMVGSVSIGESAPQRLSEPNGSIASAREFGFHYYRRRGWGCCRVWFLFLRSSVSYWSPPACLSPGSDRVE